MNRPLNLLKNLIKIPSVSRNESGTADFIMQFLSDEGIDAKRIKNNVWALSEHYNPSKPTILLNSHHDTVKPSSAYTFDPYTPIFKDNKLFGLGSNDAGASVVSLCEVFLQLHKCELPFNLLLAISAEEEVSGENGIRTLLPELSHKRINIDMAIVGEPTGMQAAIGERGLVVMDCTAYGVAGHAARNEGINALYKAIDDINRLREMKFEKVSSILGDIKVTTTMIEAGTQHNVLPPICKFVVDVRTTDAYTNEETVELIQNAIESEAIPRSTRIRASAISLSHPLTQAAIENGCRPFVSPTTSDMALMNGFPTIKIGPGESSRSHSANEFIFVDEIVSAIDKYKSIITSIKI